MQSPHSTHDEPFAPSAKYAGSAYSESLSLALKAHIRSPIDIPAGQGRQ